jgi:hypothetical protein
MPHVFILRNRRMLFLVVSIVGICLGLTTLLAEHQAVFAGPLPSASIRAIPAFARKYGMPCSSCHLAWPMLSPFGQSFKDNGYQIGNDRDAPIYQNPAYWPVSMRITPNWHRESTDRVQVDDPTTGGQTEARITNHGFDYSGLDILTAGTLAKNISFLLVPSSDETGAFHMESVNVRLDNLFNSTWLNLKFGKFELDNLLSEKRILTLSSNGGSYLNYHFQPLSSPGSPETFYGFGIGDNQVGVEWMGHSADDRTRVSASLLSSTDGNPDISVNRTYDGYFAASRAFQAGSLGLQRIGAFAYIGQAPTFFQYTEGGAPIPGVGIGNKTFYREGLIGQFYIKKYDLTAMYFHGSDSAFLSTNTPANTPLPIGGRAGIWNGGLFESHYTFNPQFILIQRYELIRMSQQPFATNPADLSNMDAFTVGYRYYPFISTRAGFAFHNEYSIVRERGAAPVTGRDLTSSSVFIGFDFAF